MVSEDISQRLATRLKEARKSQSLSLEALSRLSGVSRSMLSQIERGESSPTVAILWNLTNALNIDFSGLLDGKPNQKRAIREVIRAEQTPVILSKGSGCRIRILSPPENVGNIEIYDLEFEKNGSLVSEPHSAGCLENLTVFSGTLDVSSGEESERIHAGDTLRYVADKPHSICANGKKSRAILVVTGS